MKMNHRNRRNRRSARWATVALLPLILLGTVAVAQSRARNPRPQAQEGTTTTAMTATRDGSFVTLRHPVPPLTGDRSLWLNTDRPVAFEKGRVYAVHFWAFGCINCKRNLPHYDKWAKKFGKDLTIIGVHTPETTSERKRENLQDAMKRHGITYPVLVDPNNDNWKRWQQQYWPTVYLIDKQGRVRYYWVGELEWKGAGGEAKMRALIEQLLLEPVPVAKKEP